jgi:hypothetical protein
MSIVADQQRVEEALLSARRSITVQMYHHMRKAGIFGPGERVELIGGNWSTWGRRRANIRASSSC